MHLLERDAVVSDLRIALHQTGPNAGRMILLKGEAGIGKSSVVSALIRGLDPSIQVLKGQCDPVIPPAPLGPLLDIARQSDTDWAELLQTKPHRDLLFRSVLADLTNNRTSLLVIEDVHWADAATLDLIRFLGRRIGTTRSVLLITYRDDEIGPSHPLRAVLGDLATALNLERISLPPLSLEAVQTMIASLAMDPRNLLTITGGNPFYLSEVLAAGGQSLPTTIADAVLARAARLPAEARAVLAVAAVLGSPMEADVLIAVSDATTDEIDACVDGGMLQVEGDLFTFRHDIVRTALLSTLSPVRQMEVHREVLKALRTRPDREVTLSRLAYHAECARDTEAVIEFAVPAARQAHNRGAYREEAEQYSRIFRFLDTSPSLERAELLEAHAFAANVVDDWETAITSRIEALAIRRAHGDNVGEAENLTELSRAWWVAGRHQESIESASAAVAILEQMDEPRSLARAYTNLAGLKMLARECGEAIRIGDQAIALSRQTGDTATLAHALNYAGTARLISRQAGGDTMLEESLQLAINAKLPYNIAHAYTNLGTGLGELRDYAAADRYLDAGIAYCIEHDMDNFRWYIEAWRATTLMYEGNWSAATDRVGRLLANPGVSPIARICALHVLGRIRTRRGDPEALSALDQALALAVGTDEIQRIGPIRAARAEYFWLSQNPKQCAAEAEIDLAHALETGDRWLVGEFAHWLWRAATLTAAPALAAEPFAHQIAGDWYAAAEEWDAIGSPYEAARARADSPDEATLRIAWSTFDRLGARPDADRVLTRLRDMGVRRLPRGPRPSTRLNTANLTASEMRVLRELADGATNAVIADRLFLSPKTVEHHVSAILAKFGVSGRNEAIIYARRIGLLDPLTGVSEPN